VGLRGYGQRDPLNEYKSEAFELFENLLSRLRIDVIRQLMHIVINTEQPAPEIPHDEPRQIQAIKPDFTTGENQAEPDPYRSQRTIVNRPDRPVDPNDPTTWGKVQRNAPCPCGSGRKFKHCHGALV
jgi:preprotein translocase subunit SecA